MGWDMNDKWLELLKVNQEMYDTIGELIKRHLWTQ